jgi:hypothetical protein
MSVDIDARRLRAAVEQAERAGPLKSRNALWLRVLEIYNTGDGAVPPHNQRLLGKPIGKSTVYHKVLQFGWPLQTSMAKLGRPRGSRRKSQNSALRDALVTLESEARRWKASDPGWKSLNDARQSLGLPSVVPVDRPTPEHFADLVAASSDQVGLDGGVG